MASSAPGPTKVRKRALSTPIRNGMWVKSINPSTRQPDACAIVSVRSTPGTSGCPGKCPSNTVLCVGTIERASRRRASRSNDTIWSIISKYSSRMGSGRGLKSEGLGSAWGEAGPDRRGGSGLLGRHQRVDLRDEVLQHEVLLGRDLALVHLLRPLLKRQLDAERLVDREGDVEEREGVDAEVVDGVTLGRDLVARDVGGLGDDVGYGLVRGGHRVALRRFSGQATRPAGGADGRDRHAGTLRAPLYTTPSTRATASAAAST